MTVRLFLRPGALLLAAALACASAPSRKEREAAEIHFQLGAEALQASRREDALREFDEALRQDERHPPAHLGRGIVYQYYGKLPEAEADYRRALELDPAFSAAHNALGQLLAQTGRLPQAVAEFDRALDDMLYREAYVARCNKGLAVYRMGKQDEGVAELRTCLATAPRYCQGHRAMGQIQLERGKVKDALGSLKRYTELCEKEPDAWYQLGLAEMRAGDPEQARAAFGRCESVAGDAPVGEQCRQEAKALQ
ncbi:MAG TPA: tetratricopeptide repeat protein [Anaeromyxobacteraceae bacterium]